MVKAPLNGFMKRLYDGLIAERGVSENTANLYIRTIVRLNNNTNPTSLAFLKNIKDVVEKGSGYSTSYKHTLIASVVSVLSVSEAKYAPKLMAQYQKVMNSPEYEVAVTTSKNAKQTHNWIEQSEVIAIKEELKDKLGKQLQSERGSKRTYETYLQYVILSLYTDVPPRRNLDYTEMVVVGDLPDTTDNAVNYCDLGSHKFIFNRYKTAGTYKQQVVDIPDQLYEVIREWLKFREVKEADEPVWLLEGYKGGKFTASNVITRTLNKIFGKKVGSSMLRHIYLTDKYGSKNDQQTEDAKAMGMSVGVQNQHYIKGA